MFRQNFVYNQSAAINLHAPNPKEWEGVCMAMVYDWIKRGLCGIQVSKRTFTDVSRFFSFQRAYLQYVGHPTDFEQSQAARDNVKMTRVSNGNYDTGDYRNSTNPIDNLSLGFYAFNLYSHAGGHMAGIAVEKDRKRFFDPNCGEYEVDGTDPIGSEIESLLGRTYPANSAVTFIGGSWDIWQYVGQPRDAAWLSKNPSPPF